MFLIANPLPIILARLSVYIHTEQTPHPPQNKTPPPHPTPHLKRRNAPIERAIPLSALNSMPQKSEKRDQQQVNVMGERWTQLSPFLHCYYLYTCINSSHYSVLKSFSSHCFQCMLTCSSECLIHRFDLKDWSLKFETWPDELFVCLTLYRTPNFRQSQIERVSVDISKCVEFVI